MSTVRLRRLEADYEKLQQYVSHHPRVRLIQTEGTPPERYQLQFEILGLQQKEDRLVEARTHMVEIALPRNYPRSPPQCRMLTPIFHPNIAPHAICIGDHWSAGQPLSAIVARIGELIAYQSYNTKSPLNGEAARWTSENLDRLPLDPINMVIDEAAPSPVQALAPAPALLEFPCSQCAAQLRIPVEKSGKQVRCPRCKTVVRAPSVPPPSEPTPPLA